MKVSIKIGLHIKPNNAGKELPKEVGIRLRVSWSGLRCDLRSGYVIAPEKWDAVNSCVKLGAKNSYKQTAGQINKALIRQAALIEEILTRYELDHAGAAPTVAEFKALFDEAEGRKKKEAPEGDTPTAPGFFAVFGKFTREVGVTNNWTDATYEKFNALKNHLKAWRADVSLEGFSKMDFASFVSHLQNTAKLLNTTIAKNVGFFRWFLRWAAANGYYTGMAHENYRPRFKGLDCKEVIFLTWEELQHFLTFDFSTRPALGQVRDVFCFCAFTGLRYSDAAKLRRSDLYLDARPPYMTVITKKTTDRLNIELNNYALALLEKYAGVGFPDDKALPVISNQRMNDHLHDAAKIAGLDEPVRIVAYNGNNRQERVVPKYEVLTTHAGRRSFVVNALRLGIPAQVVMEWTGHSDYKAMKPYIKIVDEAKAVNMERFNTYGEAPAGTSKNDVPEKVPAKTQNN